MMFCRPSKYICTSCLHGLRLGRRKYATSNSGVPQIYDIVCVGGGPVGLSLLAALKSSPVTRNLKVALIESQDLTKQEQRTLAPDQYSNRASSLTPSSTGFLQEIGVWKHVDHSRTRPYDEMQVWDGNTDARVTFDWAESAQQPGRAIATMVENANFTRAMLTRLSELSSNTLSIFQNTLVSDIANGSDTEDLDLSAWPVVALSSPPPSSTSSPTPPPSIAARLLIGADGANSPVRRYAGISSSGWDYDRHGLVATLKSTTPPTDDDSPFPEKKKKKKKKTTAFQRFLPPLGGPIALLPLPDNHISLAWSTTPQNAAFLKSLSLDAFTTLINASFRLSMPDLRYLFKPPSSTISESEDKYLGFLESELSWRLKHTRHPPPSPATAATATNSPPLPWISSVQPGSVTSFPLRHLHASSYISPRVALVGDAAHTIHPHAGQGLNLGLGDAQALAATIEDAVAVGADIGDVMALERYPRERWGVNAAAGGVCDGLHKLYSHDGGPFAWARSLGANVVENMPRLKGLMMWAAEGKETSGRYRSGSRVER